MTKATEQKEQIQGGGSTREGDNEHCEQPCRTEFKLCGWTAISVLCVMCPN